MKTITWVTAACLLTFSTAQGACPDLRRSSGRWLEDEIVRALAQSAKYARRAQSNLKSCRAHLHSEGFNACTQPLLDFLAEKSNPPKKNTHQLGLSVSDQT